MDQLLLDAKRLASRLREHNASSDALIGQANNLHFKVDAMKQVTMSKFGLELFFYSFVNIKLWFYMYVRIILLYTVIDKKQNSTACNYCKLHMSTATCRKHVLLWFC